MVKTLLSLLFTGLACSSVSATPAGTSQVLRIENDVEIYSKNNEGWVESPHIKIINATDRCAVSANDFGKQDFLAIAPFYDAAGKPHVVQVVSAVFGKCRVYFGRVRSLDPRDKEAHSKLLGVQSRSLETFEVVYKGATIVEQMNELALQLYSQFGQSSHPNENSDTSLVLLAR